MMTLVDSLYFDYFFVCTVFYVVLHVTYIAGYIIGTKEWYLKQQCMSNHTIWMKWLQVTGIIQHQIPTQIMWNMKAQGDMLITPFQIDVFLFVIFEVGWLSHGLIDGGVGD